MSPAARSHSKPRRAALALLALLAALGGCGQKGPLYLPGSPQDPAAEQDEDERAEERDREANDGE